MSETATKALVERNLLKETLQSSLFHAFYMNGYSSEESAKLVNISASIIKEALDLAHAAYKLHVEAISCQPNQPFMLSGDGKV